MNIANKTVLITGVNRGIGRSSMRHLDGERRGFMQVLVARCELPMNE